MVNEVKIKWLAIGHFEFYIFENFIVLSCVTSDILLYITASTIIYELQ